MRFDVLARQRPRSQVRDVLRGRDTRRVRIPGLVLDVVARGGHSTRALRRLVGVAEISQRQAVRELCASSRQSRRKRVEWLLMLEQRSLRRVSRPAHGRRTIESGTQGRKAGVGQRATWLTSLASWNTHDRGLGGEDQQSATDSHRATAIARAIGDDAIGQVEQPFEQVRVAQVARSENIASVVAPLVRAEVRHRLRNRQRRRAYIAISGGHGDQRDTVRSSRASVSKTPSSAGRSIDSQSLQQPPVVRRQRSRTARAARTVFLTLAETPMPHRRRTAQPRPP